RAQLRPSACEERDRGPPCGANGASKMTPKRDCADRTTEEGNAILPISAQPPTREPTTASHPPPYPVSRVFNLLNAPCWPTSYGPYVTALCVSGALTILLLIASI
ncbi:hypothetical protein AAVH_35982, partial [Aphelenchoides avenae]